MPVSLRTLAVRSLAIAFAMVALPGCMTLNKLDTDTCILRRGVSFKLPIIGGYSFRNDKASDECLVSRAATEIGRIQKKDGTPDMQLLNFSVHLYEQSAPNVKKLMDEMFREKGINGGIEAVRYEIQNYQGSGGCAGVEKAIMSDGTVISTFKCAKRPQ